MDETSEGWDPLKRWGDNRPVSFDQLEAMKLAREFDPHAYEMEPPAAKEVLAPFAVDNLVDFIKPGLTAIDSLLNPTYSIRCQSTGDAANTPAYRILMETVYVSSRAPCKLTFDQYILTPFTGGAIFDLLECPASDTPVFDTDHYTLLSGGAHEVTLATRSGGFTDGVTTGAHSTFTKIITENKIYRVKFYPGTEGDGTYTITVTPLPPSIKPVPDPRLAEA